MYVGGSGGGGRLKPANILGPNATLNTEIHKNLIRIKALNSVNASKQNIKIKLINIKLLTIANAFLLNIAVYENFSANKYQNGNYY